MLTARDEKRLQGVHPELIVKLRLVFAEFEDTAPLFVVQGLRTAEQQHELWRQGREIPGPHATINRPMGDVVTMKDGYKNKSNHQAHADGLGHAADVAFVPTASEKDPFAKTWPWEKFGEALEAQQLRWGGRFNHPVDLDHAELV